MTDGELSLPNMCLLRCDRDTRGGGVALYYRKPLTCVEIVDTDITLSDTLWCRLRLETGDYCIIGVIYRPPSSSESHNLNLLTRLRTAVIRYSPHVLLMGDFNLPKLFTRVTHPENSMEHQFQSLFSECILFNHAHEPTRIRGLDRPSQLDLILTNEESMIDRVEYNPPLGKSDHVTMMFDYVCRAERPSDLVKSYRRIDYSNLLISLFEAAPLGVVGNTVDEQWSSLMSILNEKIDSNSTIIPWKDRKTPTFAPRSRTKKWMALRNSAWYVYRVTKCDEDWERFRGLRNRVVMLLKEDKLRFQEIILKQMQRNPKLLYQIVNSKLKSKPGIPPLAHESGLTETPVETANVLADFYATVYAPKESVVTASTQVILSESVLDDLLFDPVVIANKLRSLRRNASPGIDGITPLLLQKCVEPLSYPLAQLFSNSLLSGTVPADWKCAVISPIYKGGIRSDAANYRPVSLLPVISKVMERVVSDALKTHLESQHLISKAQHGFRSHHSCLTNLLFTLNDWTKMVDEGCGVHACYIDISKAFDRVNHAILLQKLQTHGVAGKVLNWLCDYLTGRSAQVRVDGSLSRKIAATSGVPQGSVLGPILFLIFMNDLPQLAKCSITLFADDIKLWTSIKCIEDCSGLQSDLDALHEWSLQNRLPFNFRKCKMLNLGKQFNYTYKLGSHTLGWTDSEKDLGVWICGSLKSSLQCRSVYNRASRLLGMLRRTFCRFTTGTVQMVINTYIRPTMEYAIQAWAPWLQKDIVLLQGIYRRLTKMVVGLENLPYPVRLIRLNLFDSRYRQIRGDLILTYRILTTPDHPLKHLFVPGSTRDTRSHALSVSIPNSRLNCRRHFFSVRVCFLWNALPSSVVYSTTEEAFKLHLDTFARQNPHLIP